MLREMYELRLVALRERAGFDSGHASGPDRDVAELLMEYGNRWAALTGDRVRAAELYAQGHGLGDRSRPLSEKMNLPAWWPPSPDGQTLYVPPSGSTAR